MVFTKIDSLAGKTQGFIKHYKSGLQFVVIHKSIESGFRSQIQYSVTASDSRRTGDEVTRFYLCTLDIPIYKSVALLDGRSQSLSSPSI